MEIGIPPQGQAKERGPLTQSEIRDIVIRRMDNKIADGQFDEMHSKRFGIRSRQITAVIDLLIELKIIREDNLFIIKQVGKL